jgi:hypothetical protein
MAALPARRIEMFWIIEERIRAVRESAILRAHADLNNALYGGFFPDPIKAEEARTRLYRLLDGRITTQD